MTTTLTQKSTIKLELLREKDSHRDHSWYFSAPGLEGSCDAVHLYLFHSKGGTSYYDGHRYEAGYYLSIRPVEITEYGEQFEMFDKRACKMFITESSRFNRRKLEALHDVALGAAAEYVHQLAGIE
ncbi:hypothetical protein GS464_29520 [Rhodococcus hoagii]|nr:hypothetical protein [Prescottella equi]